MCILGPNRILVPQKVKNDSERIRTTYSERNFLGRVHILKNRFLWFLVVYRGFRGFLRFFTCDPQIKNLKINQKIDFPKIASKHVLMVNMILKHVQDVRRTHFMPYNMILNNLKQFMKNRFFTKNAIFCFCWIF